MANKDRNFIIRISEKLLEEFQEFCDDNSMNASKRIRKYIENDVESWKRRKLQQQQNNQK
jgi:predicted house-cleaning noncanonical NTP pyrophosphatase (MazG superfamily)